MLEDARRRRRRRNRRRGKPARARSRGRGRGHGGSGRRRGGAVRRPLRGLVATRSVSVCSACCVRGVNGRAVGCFAPHAIGSVVGAGGTRTDSSSSIVIMSWSMWLTRTTIGDGAALAAERAARRADHRVAEAVGAEVVAARRRRPTVITSGPRRVVSAFFCSSGSARARLRRAPQRGERHQHALAGVGRDREVGDDVRRGHGGARALNSRRRRAI